MGSLGSPLFDLARRAQALRKGGGGVVAGGAAVPEDLEQEVVDAAGNPDAYGDVPAPVALRLASQQGRLGDWRPVPTAPATGPAVPVRGHMRLTGAGAVTVAPHQRRTLAAAPPEPPRPSAPAPARGEQQELRPRADGAEPPPEPPRQPRLPLRRPEPAPPAPAASAAPRAKPEPAPEPPVKPEPAPAPGKRPRLSTGDALGEGRRFDFEVGEERDGYTTLHRSDGLGRPIRVPSSSVQRWAADLDARLIDVPHGLDARVDDVLDGHAVFRGKGNDGLVWTTADGWAVKADTVALYHPDADGQRTPDQAARHLEREHAAHEALAGAPMVPECELLHAPGGRALLIKPALDTAPRLTADDLQAVEAAVSAIHARGWAVGDRVQVGRDAQGQLWIYDLGSAIPAATKYQREGDLDRLPELWAAHGMHRPPSPAELAQNAGRLMMLVGSLAAKQKRASDRLVDDWRRAEAALAAYQIGHDPGAYEARVDEVLELERQLAALPARAPATATPSR